MSKWIQVKVVSGKKASAGHEATTTPGAGFGPILAVGGSLAILAVIALAIWFFGFRGSEDPLAPAIAQTAGESVPMPAAQAFNQLPVNDAGANPAANSVAELSISNLTLPEDSTRRLASEQQVAIVNGEPITEAMLEREVGIGRVLYPLLQSIPVENDPATLERMRSDILSSLIDERLLVQAAREAGLEIRAEDVEARWGRMLERTQLSMEELNDRLALVGVTMDDMRISLRSTMLAEEFVAQNPAPEGVTAQSTYSAWVKALQKDGEVQILIGDEVAKVVKIGQPAPPFTLRDPNGEAVSLADHAGQPVIVNFWATWCAPCRFEMPLLEETYQKYKDDGLTVLAVDVQEGPDLVTPYIEEMGLTFPVALDRGGAVAAAYRVNGLPTTIFVDPNGVVTDIHRGALVEQTLQAYLADLLQNREE